MGRFLNKNKVSYQDFFQFSEFSLNKHGYEWN